jgi:hypothetical protein
VKVLLLTLIFLGAAWGQWRVIPADKMAEAEAEFFDKDYDRSILYPPGNPVPLRLEPETHLSIPQLDSIQAQLARLDSLSRAKPKAAAVTWEVKADTQIVTKQGFEWKTYELVNYNDTRITWYLYIVQRGQRFRVCEVELMEEP